MAAHSRCVLLVAMAQQANTVSFPFATTANAVSLILGLLPNCLSTKSGNLQAIPPLSLQHCTGYVAWPRPCPRAAPRATSSPDPNRNSPSHSCLAGAPSVRAQPSLTTQLLAADLSLLRFDAEALDCIRQTLSQPSSSSVARAAVFAARSGAAPLALEVLNLIY